MSYGGYTSGVYIFMKIKNLTVEEVVGIIERTFDADAYYDMTSTTGAPDVNYGTTEDNARVVVFNDYIPETEWDVFASDIKAFREAVRESGGVFVTGSILRKGAATCDAEVFVVKDGTLEHRVAETTWVLKED